ncbi:MAG: hypothetical protein PHX84_03385 [Candidatus Shapirobacteria bacterium]|jgi:hypothetical protein|nr:hypothetical protein [Candidatus Shapirobacteria bacterium]
MVPTNPSIDKKLEITVEKTIEAVARIQRFIIKYGSKLSDNQKEKIAQKIKELQKYL